VTSGLEGSLSLTSPLARLAALEVSLVDPVIELDRDLDHLAEVRGSLDPDQFVLDFFLESFFEDSDVRVLVPV
jgi:hypothetical protein